MYVHIYIYIYTYIYTHHIDRESSVKVKQLFVRKLIKIYHFECM